VNSQPTIESSTDLVFAPYNFSYPGIEKDITASKINPSKDFAYIL
jgi:hypothetical protein